MCINWKQFVLRAENRPKLRSKTERDFIQSTLTYIFIEVFSHIPKHLLPGKYTHKINYNTKIATVFSALNSSRKESN